jgi:hypothetical protein
MFCQVRNRNNFFADSISLQTTSLRTTTSSSATSALRIAFLASAARPYARASSTDYASRKEEFQHRQSPFQRQGADEDDYLGAIILHRRAGEAQAKKRAILAPSLQGNPKFPLLPLSSALFSGFPFVRVQNFGGWMYSRCCSLLWVEWNEGNEVLYHQ